MSDGFIFLIATAVLGAMLGSFVNALSFRYNTGRTMGGRSRCMRCGHTLGALDLVPIFSYLVLRGHCRHCGARISLQYPLVEVLAAALSLGVYMLYPTGSLPYALFLSTWMTILFIVVYDLRHTVIPWSASALLALLAFASLFLHGIPSASALLAGPLLALPLFLLSLVSRGRWMGWGDSAFELSLGWLLGATAGLSGFFLAFWSGAIVGLILLVVSQLPWKSRRAGFTMKSEIPFAPFLALGAALVFFFNVDFLSTFPVLW